MADICKHCGATLTAASERCATCGAGATSLFASDLGPAQGAAFAPPTTLPAIAGDPSPLPSQYTAQMSQNASLPPAPGASGTPPRSRRRLWLILGLVAALLLAVCGGCGGTLYWAIASQLAPGQRGVTVLLRDSLLDSTGAWPYQANQCGYVSSGYLVNGATCVASAPTFDDFDLSVTVRQTDGSAPGFYGILFRQNDGLNGYAFDISTAGQWGFQRISPNELFPDQPNREIFVYPKKDPYIHSGGATNTLFIRAIGGRFTFYANNLKLGEVADNDPLTSGHLGLTATAGAQATFTNLLVTRPG